MCECMSLAAIDNTPAQFVEVLKTVSILLLYFLPFCLFVFLSFCLFVYTSCWSNVWRVSSLKSHSLCRYSKVAVTHWVTHWPRSGIELPGQLKTNSQLELNTISHTARCTMWSIKKLIFNCTLHHVTNKKLILNCSKSWFKLRPTIIHAMKYHSCNTDATDNQ